MRYMENVQAERFVDSPAARARCSTGCRSVVTSTTLSRRDAVRRARAGPAADYAVNLPP